MAAAQKAWSTKEGSVRSQHYFSASSEHFQNANTVFSSSYPSMISLLFWNIRGVANAASVRRLRKLCKLHSVSLLILFEPFLSPYRVGFLCTALHFTHCFSSSQNKIWVLWCQGLSVTITGQSDQYIHASVTHPLYTTPVFITGIYAKCTRQERNVLWSSLLALLPSVGSAPWLLGGDYNAIASLNEYKGSCTPDLLSISDFSSFIHQGAFHDIPTTSGFFTWSGTQRGGKVHKRLDRLLCNTSWITSFPGGSLTLLSRACSDHCPLLYTLSMLSPTGPKPFKFQHMWFHRPNFMDVIRTSWTGPSAGYGMLCFSLKLKRLKADLREWNKAHFGDVHQNVLRHELGLRQQERLFEASGSDTDLRELNKAHALYTRSLLEEETFLEAKITQSLVSRWGSKY